ncbi:hypothetical protein [Sphingomonas sp. LM7]|uniref:hypothetical protein n=1 Tax=Sphingomonas sp. LM7 TaxID=1938607 RepID=UPI000983DE6C|nr:hypothetical protein [Sphingomonas sp. LM7]AQR75160.1 hypothetical protein BXU08_17180 [Sphingomonas sp. LM7]
MSLLLAAAMLSAPLAQDAPAAADSPAEEIVVQARMTGMKVRLKYDWKRRVRACSVSKSSGDADFDRTACETTVACARTGLRGVEPIRACVRPQLVAYARAQIAQKEQE